MKKPLAQLIPLLAGGIEDLSKPEGVAALYQRIERSAWLVCKDSTSPWEDAVSTVNQPQLTALHRAKTEKPV